MWLFVVDDYLFHSSLNQCSFQLFGCLSILVRVDELGRNFIRPKTVAAEQWCTCCRMLELYCACDVFLVICVM